MNYLPAKSVKKGDIIVLDCGYGGEPFCDKDCKVKMTYEYTSPFGTEKLISFKVEILDYTKDQFDTCGFNPEDKIEIKKRI